MDKLLTNNC